MVPTSRNRTLNSPVHFAARNCIGGTIAPVKKMIRAPGLPAATPVDRQHNMYALTVLNGVEALLAKELSADERSRCGIVARNVFHASTGALARDDADLLTRDHVAKIRSLGNGKQVGVVYLHGDPTSAADARYGHMACALVVRGEVHVLQSYHPSVVFQRRLIPLDGFADALERFLPEDAGTFRRTPERLEALPCTYCTGCRATPANGGSSTSIANRSSWRCASRCTSARDANSWTTRAGTCPQARSSTDAAGSRVRKSFFFGGGLIFGWNRSSSPPCPDGRKGR